MIQFSQPGTRMDWLPVIEVSRWVSLSIMRQYCLSVESACCLCKLVNSCVCTIDCTFVLHKVYCLLPNFLCLLPLHIVTATWCFLLLVLIAYCLFLLTLTTAYCIKFCTLIYPPEPSNRLSDESSSCNAISIRKPPFCTSFVRWLLRSRVFISRLYPYFHIWSLNCPSILWYLFVNL